MEYQSRHSIGTAPIITDGDLVLGESAAIIDYIIHIYGQGRLSIASGDPTYADYLFWFHFANGSFMPAAMMDLVTAMAAAAVSAAVSALTQRLDRAWEIVEGRLGESRFLAGADFTAAHIMTLFPLTTMRLFCATGYC